MISSETIELIHKLAKENRLWGAERMRGELLKLGIGVSKRTIQKYMPKERQAHSSSQTWATFLKNQASVIWDCDFTVANDCLFRSWYIFVVLELKTRRIAHIGVTQFPTDEWTAQQLREATPWGSGPKYLIRDRDSKYARHFSAVAAGSDIQELKTPYRTRAPMEFVKGSWAVYEWNAWIISPSMMGSICSEWSSNTRITTIRNDRIRGSVSVFSLIMLYQNQSHQEGGSPRRRSLADYITVI